MMELVGIREQRVPGVRSFDAAHAQHQWRIPERYNIAWDCLYRARDEDVALILADQEEPRRVTFGELRGYVRRWQNVLTAGMDVRPGDRVGMMLGQSLEAAIVILAVLRAGAVLVPISKLLAADAITYRLEKAGGRVLIAGVESAALVEEVRSRLSDIQVVLVEADGQPNSFWDLLQKASPEAGLMRTAPEDPAVLMFTSGTTGKPKGVLHAHRFLPGHIGLDYAMNFYQPDDIFYGPADWAWLGGLMLGFLAPLSWGVPTVVFRARRFDPEETMHLMVRNHVSLGFFPATALRMMRSGSARPVPMPRLRCMLTGAEAITPDLFRWVAAEMGFPLHNGFGLTEANALVGHCSALEPVVPEALGRPFPGHRIAVLDDDLQEVAPGEMGILALRADDPTCMLGYWNDPEATADKIRSGWLLTGDLAIQDQSGLIYFHGRNDDLIKSGGYRIGPVEIESAMLSHDAVAECAAVGVPDPVRGDIIKVFVRLRRPVAVGKLEQELKEVARQKLGAYARPKAYEVVDEFPRSSTGKVSRAELRRRHQAGG